VNIELVVAETPDNSDREIILQGLRVNNAAAGRPTTIQHAAILVRNTDSGETVGGLWAHTMHDWMFVELLSVPNELRGMGLGSKLMEQAERLAMARNCLGIWLDTFEFQAPDFYRKMGFEQCGSIDDHPKGMSRLIFRKRLSAQGAAPSGSAP
jgi:ribosomal protein S18 acetylase RimI-like enzyme